MVIGDRLKQLRESKGLSQGHIEKATGLLRCYISRVENGHTVPSIETLEKLARALGEPMWNLFTDQDVKLAPGVKAISGGSEFDGPNRKFAAKLARKVAHFDQRDQRLLLKIAGAISRAA